jgi:hypothetical protein
MVNTVLTIRALLDSVIVVVVAVVVMEEVVMVVFVASVHKWAAFICRK